MKTTLLQKLLVLALFGVLLLWGLPRLLDDSGDGRDEGAADGSAAQDSAAEGSPQQP